MTSVPEHSITKFLSEIGDWRQIGLEKANEASVHSRFPKNVD